ncbi:hypothetical protein ACFX13_029227 [Malus domestica]
MAEVDDAHDSEDFKIVTAINPNPNINRRDSAVSDEDWGDFVTDSSSQIKAQVVFSNGITTTQSPPAATSSFIGTRLPSEAYSNSGRVQGQFGFGTKKRPPKKSTKPTFSTDRPFWYPGAKAPEWLDGTLVGNYGFDPFDLGKPAEYLQYDYDGLDQNLANNLAGDIIGT